MHATFYNQRPGTIIFTLTAAQLVMEVTISAIGITLNTLQGSNNPAVLSSIIGSTIKLDELIKLMRNAACDVFASEDAFCYTEGSCEKNFVMEMHIYNCMAYFASSHNFAWSRWNSQAGSRTAILLMRELIEHRKLVNEVTLSFMR
jgi:cancer susceptibility candidate protein 1